jgi:trk system potassium uptake protein TrkH
VNFVVVVRVLGNLLILEALGLILPLLISIWYKQHDWISFLICIILAGIIGCLMIWIPSIISRKKESGIKKDTIKIKEALVIVPMGWILVSFFGALPFIFSGSIPSFADAFFETVSGFTTTGATILKDIEAIPHGILFWRSFTHWIGGMGILVFTVAILPALGVGSFQIFKAESPGPIAGRIVPRIKDTAKILYTTYLLMTALETFLLVLGGMSLYDALIHTFGTVGTGGFSNRNTSVGAFGSTYINIVIAVFMVLAASNFSLYYALYKRKWKEVIRDPELRYK